MSEEKRRKIQNFISVISLILVGVIALFLLIASRNQKLTGTVFNVIIIAFLVFYCILLDIVEPILLKQFENFTKERKTAYVKYIVTDAVGYAGIAMFICLLGNSSSNKGLNGAVIYVICICLKRKFKEEFLGVPSSQEKMEDRTETEEKNKKE